MHSGDRNAHFNRDVFQLNGDQLFLSGRGIAMNEEATKLLSRIDERTKNIEARQLEEIGERKDLDKRIDVLENWRNFIVGGLAVIGFVFAAGVQYLEKKLNGH